MRNSLIYIPCFLLMAGMVSWHCGPASPKSLNPQVVIETNFGTIVAEVDTQRAPLSAGTFLKYVEEGLYENASFYRILSEDNQPMGTDAARLIQGGIYRKKDAPDSLPGIRHESTQLTGILHERGTLSLARQDTGTASSEFFICIDKQPGFDYGGNNNADGQGYAAFGKVVEGMEVVMDIFKQKENSQLFTPPITIKKIRRKP